MAAAGTKPCTYALLRDAVVTAPGACEARLPARGAGPGLTDRRASCAIDAHAPGLAPGDPAMPPRALGSATRVLAGRAEDEALQGVAGPAANAKALRDAGEDPAVVPVQPDGEAGLAGGSTANGGCLSADDAQTEGAADLAAAFCGVPVAFGGERLAVCTAAASRGGGNLAAFDTERMVGLAALALAAGAMGLATGLEAVPAAAIAVCGPVLSAAQAQAGLAPFIALALLAGPVCRAVILPAGVAAAGAGFGDGGAAVAAEAEIVQQEAALAFRLA